MLRDSRLAVWELLFEVTNADRPVGGHSREELETDWISESSEDLDGQVPGLGDDARLGV
jgi:hypothetical protein